jgi:hypothetical protein
MAGRDEVLEQVERRGVGPMDVLDGQRRGTRPTQRRQQSTQRGKQALLLPRVSAHTRNSGRADAVRGHLWHQGRDGVMHEAGAIRERALQPLPAIGLVGGTQHIVDRQQWHSRHRQAGTEQYKDSVGARVERSRPQQAGLTDTCLAEHQQERPVGSP